MRRVMMLFAGLVLVTASDLGAAPVTLDFAGTLSNTVAVLEAGTPVNLQWTVSGFYGDECALATGFYSNQVLRLEIGGYVWTATGSLIAGTNTSIGCSNDVTSTNELRVIWSGPTFPGYELARTDGCCLSSHPGLFYSLFPASAARPDEHTIFRGTYLDGPRFWSSSSGYVSIRSGDLRRVVVPEPAIGMLAAQAVGLFLLRQRRRRRSSTRPKGR